MNIDHTPTGPYRRLTGWQAAAFGAAVAAALVVSLSAAARESAGYWELPVVVALIASMFCIVRRSPLIVPEVPTGDRVMTARPSPKRRRRR